MCSARAGEACRYACHAAAAKASGDTPYSEASLAACARCRSSLLANWILLAASRSGGFSAGSMWRWTGYHDLLLLRVCSYWKHRRRVVNAAVLRATPHARRDADGRLGPALAILWTPRRRALPSNSHDRALLLVATPALAGPLDDPHVGSLGFSGPTTGDLTAVYWNPAALGLLQGNQFMFGASLRATQVTVIGPRSSHRRGCRAAQVVFHRRPAVASSSPWPGHRAPRAFSGGRRRGAAIRPGHRHLHAIFSEAQLQCGNAHALSPGERRLSTTRPGFRASHRTHGFVASRCRAGAALQLRPSGVRRGHGTG